MNELRRKLLKSGSAFVAGLALVGGGEEGLAQGKRVPMTPEKLMLAILNLAKRAREDGFGETADGLMGLVDGVIHNGRKGTILIPLGKDK